MASMNIIISLEGIMKKTTVPKKRMVIASRLILLLVILPISSLIYALDFEVVNTGQVKCFDNQNEITAPAPGGAFYGQDAQFSGNQPSYTDNGDGTVTDNITGLMWSKTCNTSVDNRLFHFLDASSWLVLF